MPATKEVFSVTDEPFSVAAGIYDFRKKSLAKSPTQFPGNFVIETTATELPVVGTGAEYPNKAYYRVVAVDAKSNRSGPSDYAEAPRPAIYSQPIAQTKIGDEYEYQIRSIRSIGDSRSRVIDGREVMNYWDVEQPRFELLQGPKWLSIDAATGRLFGKPDAPGRADVVVAITLEREDRRLDPAQLQWGIEKPVGARVEAVGKAKQSFAIETKP